MSATVQLPNNTSLSFVQGDDFSFSVDINRDLTNYTVTAYIISKPTNTAFTLNWVSRALGTFTLSLDDSQTALLPSSCLWVLEWVDPADDKRTLIQGNVTVLRK
jgi:hypothetical protein